jgi:hypothetical protein
MEPAFGGQPGRAVRSQTRRQVMSKREIHEDLHVGEPAGLSEPRSVDHLDRSVGFTAGCGDEI